MRAVITLEDRFWKTPQGHVYSQSVYDYSFWQQHLSVFDDVIVIARFLPITTIPDKPRADGPRVTFWELPNFVGSLQYLLRYRQIISIIEKRLEKTDAFILRVPGIIATALWRCLGKRRIPFAVQVVGDPWESLAAEGVKGLFTPVARRILQNAQRKQCLQATAVSYVTKSTLQQRYPSRCWSTHFSNVEIRSADIIDEAILREKLATLRDIARRSITIYHVGSMTTLYKAQHILIDAVSLLEKQGRQIELVLIGDGRYREYFCKRAQILHKTRFLGSVSRERVFAELDKADLFVLPSLTEGLPRSLLEAMARGIPAIASDTGGIPEILRREDLVAAGDAVALAEKIGEVIADYRRLERMVHRNLQTVQEYRQDILMVRRMEFYRQVAERNHRQ